MLELECYKADNDRLIKLLNSTKEFKDFAEFAQDNKGSVRYLAGEKKYGKSKIQDDEEEESGEEGKYKEENNSHQTGSG